MTSVVHFTASDPGQATPDEMTETLDCLQAVLLLVPSQRLHFQAPARMQLLLLPYAAVVEAAAAAVAAVQQQQHQQHHGGDVRVLLAALDTLQTVLVDCQPTVEVRPTNTTTTTMTTMLTCFSSSALSLSLYLPRLRSCMVNE